MLTIGENSMKNIKKFTNRSRKNSEYYLAVNGKRDSAFCDVCNCDPCDCNWGYNKFNMIVISNGGTFESITEENKETDHRSSD